MSRAALCLVASVLFITPARPAAQSPVRDAPAQPGTGIIRGRVVDASSGEPVRKARVRASSTALKETRLAVTDGNGRYELKELPAGKYTISTSKPTYITTPYGKERPNDQGKVIDLAEAQTIDRIDVPLARGGVVTGRIIDDFGDPMADVRVWVMRQQFDNGRARLVPVTPGGPRTTNDIGEFRVFGIPPGEYVLQATFQNFLAMGGDTNDRSAYVATFSPGTADVGEAQRLRIAAGQTLSGLTMRLVSAHGVRVSGTAVDAAGQTMRSGGVFLEPVRRNGSFGANVFGTIHPDGTFSIGNVAPGEYIARAGSGGRLDLEAAARITVGASDVSDVRLAAVQRSKLTGRILVDGGRPSALKTAGLRVFASAASQEDGQLAYGDSSLVKDDLTFELKPEPGRFLIRINSTAPEWTLKSVRVNGIDVTDGGVNVAADSTIDGLEVQITNHASELSGTVSNERGETTRNAFVIVFAQDREKWGYESRYVTMQRPAADSKYKARLVAGAYYAVAIDDLQPGDWSNPDYLDRIRERAVAFTISEAERKTLDLNLVSLSRD